MSVYWGCWFTRSVGLLGLSIYWENNCFPLVLPLMLPLVLSLVLPLLLSLVLPLVLVQISADPPPADFRWCSCRFPLVLHVKICGGPLGDSSSRWSSCLSSRWSSC